LAVARSTTAYTSAVEEEARAIVAPCTLVVVACQFICASFVGVASAVSTNVIEQTRVVVAIRISVKVASV
jgi:hypothetical protein